MNQEIIELLKRFGYEEVIITLRRKTDGHTIKLRPDNHWDALKPTISGDEVVFYETGYDALVTFLNKEKTGI